MLKIAERVDHRDEACSAMSFDRAVAKRTQHDAVDPALEVVGNIAQRFAGVHATGRLVDEKEVPPSRPCRLRR